MNIFGHRGPEHFQKSISDKMSGAMAMVAKVQPSSYENSSLYKYFHDKSKEWQTSSQSQYQGSQKMTTFGPTQSTGMQPSGMLEYFKNMNPTHSANGTLSKVSAKKAKRVKGKVWRGIDDREQISRNSYYPSIADRVEGYVPEWMKGTLAKPKIMSAMKAKGKMSLAEGVATMKRGYEKGRHPLGLKAKRRRVK